MSSRLPNYVTPTSQASWNYDVLHYYNQYYATEKETQNRRIARNYAMYQADLKKQNQSMILYPNDKGIKTYFFYTFLYSYLIQEYPEVNGLRENRVYIRIQNHWCLQKIIHTKPDQCLFDMLFKNKFNYLLSLFKR